MKEAEVLIVGGGPAGLCAAIAAASQGARALVCERGERAGGQLVKQTHKFFGSRAQYAGERGIAIGGRLIGAAEEDAKIEIMTETTVIGIYEDGTVLAERGEKIIKIKPKKIIIATGASENFLPFPGNDLPGVYGAGAVQTLMNQHGVKPGSRVLMIGAGNIGLIVSYQLAQAGVEVAAALEAAPRIRGGYLVHASKISRIGIPVRTGCTIKEAYGNGKVEGAVICRIGGDRRFVAGSQEDVKCDTICLAVGLTPLNELCWQAGCKMAYIGELSGHVPVTDGHMATTNPDIFVAGDASGVEEASSAMVGGRLAGYQAAISLGYGKGEAPVLRARAAEELKELRAGLASEGIRRGLEKMQKLRFQKESEGGIKC